MTVHPSGLTRLDHPLSLGEWVELPETEFRCELVEGVPVVVAAPLLAHQRLVMLLARRLSAALPADREVAVGVDVLVDPAPLPTVRVPDLSVIVAGLPGDVPHLTPDHVRIVVEVLSPGTRRTDRVAKVHDYAEAGIPFYVVADPAEAPHLVVLALVGSAYEVVDEGPEVVVDGVRLDGRAPGTAAQSSR